MISVSPATTRLPVARHGVLHLVQFKMWNKLMHVGRQNGTQSGCFDVVIGLSTSS
jgi:hypothetical protein